jgi:hypothetical protein
VTMGGRTGAPRFARKRLPVDTSFGPLSTKRGRPSGPHREGEAAAVERAGARATPPPLTAAGEVR